MTNKYKGKQKGFFFVVLKVIVNVFDVLRLTKWQKNNINYKNKSII